MRQPKRKSLRKSDLVAKGHGKGGGVGWTRMKLGGESESDSGRRREARMAHENI